MADGPLPWLQVARIRYLEHVAVVATRALAERDVASVLLKGSSFGQLWYGPGERRTFTDVDLLVAPTQVAHATAVLAEHGFEDTFAGAAPSETSPYATELRGPRAVIDLHHTLPGVTVSGEQAWQLLAEEPDHIGLPDGPVPVLTVPGRALHAVLDVASDGAAAARLDDVERAIGRLPFAVWQDALELAEGLGALPSFAAGLALLPGGRELARRLGVDPTIPTDVALRASTPPPLALGLDQLVTTPGIRGRVAFLARRLVPTPSGLRYWSPLARRGRLGMALAYAWRPFYLAVHAPRAFGAWRRARAVSRDREG